MKIHNLINLHLQNANTYSNQPVPTKTRIYLNSKNINITGNVFVDSIHVGGSQGWVLVKDGVLSLTGARDYIRSVTSNDPNLVTVSYDYAVSSQPNDKALGELSKAEELLNQLEHLDNSQSTNASLILQQDTLNQELRGLNQQIIKIEQQITPLQSQINNFNIASQINPLSPAEKAHLLQKIWTQKDDFSQSIVALIQDQEFNPHYANRENISLVDMALRIDDINFFKLLISKGLKFEQIAKTGKSFFTIILDSNKEVFIKMTLATKQDFSKSLALLISQGEKAKLTKLFALDPELVKTTYAGYSLLKVAIAENKLEIVSNILDVNPEGLQDPSIVQVAINKAGQDIITLLSEKGADVNKTFITCIKQNRIEAISKILSIKPNMLNEIAVNLTQAEAFDVFSSNNKICEIFDAKGHNLLYYCLINSNIEAIKIFSEVTAKASLNKHMLNVFTQILEEDISLDTKIGTFKVIIEAKILDKGLIQEFGNIADIVEQYLDINLMLQEAEADLMGQVL